MVTTITECGSTTSAKHITAVVTAKTNRCRSRLSPGLANCSTVLPPTASMCAPSRVNGAHGGGGLDLFQGSQTFPTADSSMFLYDFHRFHRLLTVVPLHQNISGPLAAALGSVAMRPITAINSPRSCGDFDL